MSNASFWSYPNPYPMFSTEALAYSERKLAFYNEWLTDTKRKLGEPCPTFPEDLNRTPVTVKGKKMTDVTVPSTPEVASAVMAGIAGTLTGEAPAVDVKPAKKAKGLPKASDRVKGKAREGSKLEQAISIFQRLGGDKAATIAEIQSACGMSLAGATTYFYNAKKASKA